ncbi:hypothetical protein O0I10_001086 [Lichtheimia ornata]|uniref:DUF726-domain-containing protein n=1 Tax=Lichtheimia ornata TaxID=688661 RepID=A0AAD8DHH6_9FUNG|nr:uncharacterized protein O0I10_001086 [Lichtheimia ornata]KAJ8662910.1 hypothetical protein O0I10_001086 [Lichtheimia ornata]
MSKESLINLSVESWDLENKHAIARIAGQALTVVEPIVHPSWARMWWSELRNYLGLSQEELVSNPMSLDYAIQLLSNSKRDIRIEILVDLLALSMHLDHPTKKDTPVVYDARSRRFLFELAQLMKLAPTDVTAVERSVAQQMYFALQENSGEEKDPHLEDRATLMDQSAKTSIQNTNKQKKHLKWLATGAGVLGGGALIALTGGLAAPLLAPLLVGLTGATFFATAGGIALVTSLFGLTGGGLAGWKMHRRMQGLEEFAFEQILNDADLPPIPTLQCTICISGFLMDNKDEFKTPWEKAFATARNFNDIYCLRYETDALMDLGIAFEKFVRNQAIKYAGVEVAKQTALHAFFAAVALPATLMKIADVVDNPWQIAVDRSHKAGIVLADVLEKRVQGNRPCSLVGYSCGCLVIWHCLKELYARDKKGLVDHVVLMGAPIAGDDTQGWRECASVVSGRFINCFTDKDWVLAFVYRLHSLNTEVAGLRPIKNVHRIENVELQLDGHTSYRDSVQEIMMQVGMA